MEWNGPFLKKQLCILWRLSILWVVLIILLLQASCIPNEPKRLFLFRCVKQEVWPDWAIYCTLDNFSKPAETIILPKLPTVVGNFRKVVKIFHFSREIIIGQLLLQFGDFLLVTLEASQNAVFQWRHNL